MALSLILLVLQQPVMLLDQPVGDDKVNFTKLRKSQRFTADKVSCFRF